MKLTEVVHKKQNLNFICLLYTQVCTQKLNKLVVLCTVQCTVNSICTHQGPSGRVSSWNSELETRFYKLGEAIL